MTTDRGRLLRRQIMFWSLASLVAIALLVVFSSILLPFVFGMCIAYFLDPVADWLERRGLSRMMASVVILVLFVVVFTAVILIVVPVVGGHIGSFLQRLPEYLDKLQSLAAQARSGPLAWMFAGDEQSMRDDFAKLVAQGSAFLTTLAGSLWTSSLAVVNFI